jgi:hypothetical protein
LSSKKGLHKANPNNQVQEIAVQETKRKEVKVQISPKDNEREFRQMLAKKISGTAVGIWLLVPELQRLGAWDILKAWTGKTDIDLEPRIAMQLINESALCINRVRKKNSLGHQGFQLANGMGRLVTDEQVHLLLNKHSMEESNQMLINLGLQRRLSGHYKGGVIAMDPHRILSSSQRIMSKKQKKADTPSEKMLQTFFTVCAQTGQPIMATMSSNGLPTSKASTLLLSATGEIIKSPALYVADKEHFSAELFEFSNQQQLFDLLTPAINSNKIKKILKSLQYKTLWAGFALAETEFSFDQDNKKYRLIAQRQGESNENYSFSAFVTTSYNDAQQLITEHYDKRWSVEEFYRFENEMGLNRASTLNLNIRYGRLANSMIAQAATYQLRNKLKDDYKTWDARHLSNEILAWSDGDIRVNDDTIIITFYNAPKYINQWDYVNLPKILTNEGVNPKIPWLFDFKLDFRFK